MSGPSIHELLGLPADITQPNAYQVFGLQLGEADQQVIRTAIEQRVISLRKAKPSVAPRVWTTAARAVQTAQKVLTDPARKAALDAQYGIINDPQPAPPPAQPVDPLAALLPGTTATPTSATTAAPPPSANSPAPSDAAQLAAPAEPAPAATQPPLAALPTASPQTTAAQSGHANPISARPREPTGVSRRPTRRRRSWGGLLFSSAALLLLTSIVGVLGYLFFTGGEIQVSQSDGGFQISAGKGEGSADQGERDANRTVTAPPPLSTRKPQSDGIMKPPPPRGNDRPRPGSAADTGMPVLDFQAGMDSSENPDASADSEMSSDMSQPAAPPSTPPEPPTPAMPAPAPNSEPMAPADPAAAPTPEPAPTPAPNMSKPAATPAEIAAGEAAIAAARAAVTGAQWETMKQLAETAEGQAASKQQQLDAETLFQFADLATFYRGAISRAMAELNAGNEFKLTDSLTFLVQQSSAEQITLYRNKREYPYSLAELPLSVAHALAPFQLDISAPQGQAAKAAFQAISPLATPGHRSESVEILRGLDGVPGADPKRLADFIESLK